MSKDAITPLSEPERATLVECESQIGNGLGHFVTVGRALARIRDERLYRGTHQSFDGYCEDRWRFGKRRANQLIKSAEVTEVVTWEGSGNHGFPPPTQIATERQARELSKAPPAERASVWKSVTAAKASPTAKDVKMAVDRATRTKGSVSKPAAVPQVVERELKPDVRRALEEGGAAFDELMKTIQSVRRGVKALADVSHGAFIDSQAVDSYLKNAWDALKFARPHAACDKCGQRACKACERIDGGGWLPYGRWKSSRAIA